ncbi:hypothetical protein FKP32DRAFT_912597 [Trametes sanguinea]|nr:hypothetical protein FKP32DRAFT_912597 [Trametes sanguinea]
MRLSRGRPSQGDKVHAKLFWHGSEICAGAATPSRMYIVPANGATRCAVIVTGSILDDFPPCYTVRAPEVIPLSMSSFGVVKFHGCVSRDVMEKLSATLSERFAFPLATAWSSVTLARDCRFLLTTAAARRCSLGHGSQTGQSPGLELPFP